MSALFIGACNGDKNEVSDSGGDTPDPDTGDTSDDTPPTWAVADISPGAYTMRLITVTDNSCTPEYATGNIYDVNVAPAGGRMMLMEYIELENREDQMRGAGVTQTTNDATGDGAPDCTIDIRANGQGTYTSNTEFDLSLIIERTGTGDYCGSEYIGYTLPCTDVFTGLFTAVGGGGGGGG